MQRTKARNRATISDRLSQIGESLRFAFGIPFHPLKSFSAIKYERRGDLGLVFAINLLWVFSRMFEVQATGFLFNHRILQSADIFAEIRNVTLIVLLILIGNWSVTTLMDGEGTLKEIFLVIGYAALPHICIRVFMTVLSNVLSFSEGGIIGFLDVLSWVVFFALLFLGVMVVHQYTVFKTVITSFLTLISVGIIMFLLFVFLSLFWQLFGFVSLILKELQLH